MDVRLTRLTDALHAVEVVRDDGSAERVELDTRSFLRHDLAHWAVESVLGLRHGVWGSVAAGVEAYRDALAQVAGIDDPEVAVRLHEAVRRLRGHWNATAHGETMQLVWPEPG